VADAPDNPLTARVMVNVCALALRRWPGTLADNFGRSRDRPLNQPLLRLAGVRFVESAVGQGMHRLILLSSTYRWAASTMRRPRRSDPDNRLHWALARRPARCGEVRDALLAVSGQAFDLAMGGSLMQGGKSRLCAGLSQQQLRSLRQQTTSVYCR